MKPDTKPDTGDREILFARKEREWLAHAADVLDQFAWHVKGDQEDGELGTDGAEAADTIRAILGLYTPKAKPKPADKEKPAV